MVKKKVLSDIDKAKEVISDFISTHEYKKEHKFIRPYLHSNEGDFYKNIDVKGKDVLTVGSSCDQSLYSILYGANSVTLFDLNPFVQYVYDLKVAAIQRFPMLLTRQLFTINPQHTSIDFSKAVEKLAPLMSEESQFFWSSIGNDFSHKEIITGLFDQYGSRYPHFLQNPIAYQDLRSKLASTPYINFVSSSLHDLPQNLPMGSQFDIALISNVQDYYEDDIYKQDIKQIMPFMRQNGIMQLNYSYNYPKTPNNIYHPDKLDNINELFGVQAINGKIYPHLTDLLPSPLNNNGSFALPVLRENSIFVKVNDLKEAFDREETQGKGSDGGTQEGVEPTPAGEVTFQTESCVGVIKNPSETNPNSSDLQSGAATQSDDTSQIP